MTADTTTPVITTMPATGIEYLWDLQLAAAIVPMSYEALKQFLKRKKSEYPARYRIQRYRGTRRTSRVRLLYTSEIHRIRKYVLRGAI